MSNRERPPDKSEGPAPLAGEREAKSKSNRTSRKPQDNPFQAGRQWPGGAVAVYSGRYCIGGFVTTPSGILVLDADGRLVQAVATRREAQSRIWAAHAVGVRP